jgi:hypothetical protein
MGISLSRLCWRWRGTLSSKPQPCQQTSASSDPSDLKTFIKPLIASLIVELEYSPLTSTDNVTLWEAMRQYANGTGVPYGEGTHSGTCFKIGYTYPVVSSIHLCTG